MLEKPVRITEVILKAFNEYKKVNEIQSNYRFSKVLGVSESTVSMWYNKVNPSISAKLWALIKDKIEPFIDESVTGSDTLNEILDQYSDESSRDYVIAHLAKRLADLKDLVPIKIQSLNGIKRDAMKKTLEGIAELLD